MTDVAIPSTPSPSPAPAPAPAGQVAINPNPVSPPAPIGSQAPPAASDPGRPPTPQSRREASKETIRKAFARSSEPPAAAKPEMGHNRPPEPMKREARKEKSAPPPPLDLKRRPDDQPAAARSEQPTPRGDHGHFAPKGQQAMAGQQRQPGQQAQPGQQQRPPLNVVQLPAQAPYRAPPKRWDQRAKAEWGAAPESVRANVYRMHQEFSKAYQRMHGDHQEMNNIRHFHDMAKQHGTTLGHALNNYVGMENKLRSDPIGGLDVIVNNLNLRTSDGQRIGLRDIAWHVLNQSPDQHKNLQLENSQTALGRQLAQMQQQQAAIAKNLQHMQYRQEFSRTRRGVDRFAETHPRLDELGDLIQKELALGFNLKAAYQRAALLRPAVGNATHAAQTRTASAQTRSADRSIHGAPDRGLTNGQGRQKSSNSPRDAVANALKRSRASL